MKKGETSQESSTISERLKFNQAKELYKKAINTPNESLKKVYMDKLILGTIYVIDNYIERNGLEILKTSSYDREDIISSFIEVWIKKIQEGILLEVDRYSYIINSVFINEVYKKLGNENITINEQFSISTDFFIELLELYIHHQKSSSNLSFELLVKKEYLDTYKIPYSNYYIILNIIPLLDKIYHHLNLDEEIDYHLTKRKITVFLRMIINLGLIEPINNNLANNRNMEDDVLNKIVQEQLLKEIDETCRNESERQIIYKRYGLANTPKYTYHKLGQEQNMSIPKIKHIEKKLIKRIIRNKNIRNLREELN